MKSVFRKLQNRYLLSFCIPVVLMLGIFVARGIYPFGNNSFMFSDMYHQYVPFLTEFWHKLHGGESLAYSWRAGLGSDFVAIYGYYLASPVNWLCYFVPEAYLIEFMTYFIVLKIGLCGLTFAFYLSRHYDTRDLRIVWFAVFYAMSGFLAAYSWNHMWMDVIWLAPLVILGLEELVLKGSCRRYCLLLAVAILSNYYLSIMLCIFLVLWFLVQLFTNGLSLKKKALAVLRFAICSLLAGGMAGVLLIPVQYAMHTTDFVDISFPKSIQIYFNALEMLARHVPMLETERGLDHWPNIYCGVLAFVLVPVYFLHKKIPLRQKIAKFLLLAVFLLGFSVNVLNFIWHGLNYPNSLPARQSFLYIFVVLTLCFEAAWKNEENGGWQRAVGVALGLLLLAACGIFVTTDGLTVWVMASAWIFLAGYFILGALFDRRFRLKLSRRRRKKGRTGKGLSYGGLQKLQRWGAAVILVLVCVEAVCNMEHTSVRPVQRPYYLNRKAAYRELTKQVSEREDGFFRIDNEDQMTKNDGMLGRYCSMSIFSSTSNGYVKDYYDKLGMGGSKVSYYYRGATPFTAALMGVRYMISDRDDADEALYERVGTSGDRYLYRYRYSLPVGYMMSAEQKEKWESVLAQNMANPLMVQNTLAGKASGSDTLFRQVAAEECSAAGNCVTVSVKENGHLYGYVVGKPEGVITLKKEGEERTLEEADKGIALDLGRCEAGEEFTVSSDKEEQLILRVYRLSESALENVLAELGDEPFVTEQMTDDGLGGSVTAVEEGYLVLSVPADPGFQMKVDGEEIEGTTFADAMIAIPLAAGTHKIELTFRVQGLREGALCTVVSAGIFFLLYGRKKKGKRKGIEEK